MNKRTISSHTSAELAIASVILAQISINIGASLGKSMFSDVGPEMVAAMRTTFSAIILLAIARPWPLRPTPWAILYGLVLGLMNVLIYKAFQRLPIGIAISIEICGPLSVVLMTSRTGLHLMWFMLAASGLALLLPIHSALVPLDPIGVFFASAAAMCWAFYILIGKRAAQAGAASALVTGMFTACIVTVPVALIHQPIAEMSPRYFGLGLCVAALSSALPYFLEMHALNLLPSRVFGAISSASPATASVIAWVSVGETLTPRQCLAVLLIVLATLGGTVGMKAKRGRHRTKLGERHPSL
ncbi:DMT family transporter [Novosphingobium sp. LASN5T]|uniref:EamA family transporter n=1 Tax=Novosphingobium sp. LASN5T TaxID=2491021 RepID=UPI001680E4AE|nr:EamA family transporter [Novosphingobium sp. LASN5T]